MDLTIGHISIYSYMLDNLSKTEILEKLSLIEDVVFVGGTSEFLQGFKNELNDIDISVTNPEPLKAFGYVHESFDKSFFGLSGKRALIPLKYVLIDIFIDDKKPEYIVVKGYKCQTIRSMIFLRENTLNFYKEKLSEKSYNKIKRNLDLLKKAYHLR